jgi:hypothetical protein
MPHLLNITLLAVSSVNLAGTDLALQISSHDIEFGAIKFLSSEDWSPSNQKIEMVKIPKLDLVAYDKFILGDLYKYVETDYCLVVQSDGFVLNASRWNPAFLEYDYIGAPWPINLKLGDTVLDLTANNVGNGGFSLRSKKLLEVTSKITFDDLKFLTTSEDLILSHFLLQEMLNAGIKFPHPALAAKFSIESPTAAYGQNIATSFGFHGKVLRDLIFANAQH